MGERSVPTLTKPWAFNRSGAKSDPGNQSRSTSAPSRPFGFAQGRHFGLLRVSPRKRSLSPYEAVSTTGPRALTRGKHLPVLN
jgi:hypothetical protein